eukprot:SAG11_NODE_974_length_6334_cov_29.611387_6_plen_195_part_00
MTNVTVISNLNAFAAFAVLLCAAAGGRPSRSSRPGPPPPPPRRTRPTSTPSAPATSSACSATPRCPAAAFSDPPRYTAETLTFPSNSQHFLQTLPYPSPLRPHPAPPQRSLLELRAAPSGAEPENVPVGTLFVTRHGVFGGSVGGRSAGAGHALTVQAGDGVAALNVVTGPASDGRLRVAGGAPPPGGSCTPPC